jgi:hypothetical protein
MFEGYLKTPDINTVTAAAVSGNIFDFPRSLWFMNVHRGFFFTLPTSTSPLQQFQLDIAKLNTVERLENGTIPL